MKKRSLFSKIFLNNIIMITIISLVLSGTGFILISHYIYNERVDTLKENAVAIEGFIVTRVPQERLEYFLYGFSRSSNKSVIITDSLGHISTASVLEDNFDKSAKKINIKNYSDIAKGKIHVEPRGTLDGVYKQEMFTLVYPVLHPRTKHIERIIFVSIPSPRIFSMQKQLVNTMLLCIVVVLILSLLLSFALSRRISAFIREVIKAVKEYAKGNFSSRVKQDKNVNNITEIHELATAFNDMAFHLEKADDIRNNFISDVSHELRTPMTTIGGFVDGIMDGTIPPENQQEYLGIVKDEISRLSALINTFLDITRNSTVTRTLEITNFDINEVIRRVLINLESRIGEKQINVDVNFEVDPCIVKADLDSITRVLTNLLENAIKFTNEGGDIRISCSIRQQEVIISVYNTGCGISEEDQQFIFERFYKADKSRSQNKEGTGIGLYIVKEIINRHGKNIGIRSVENQYAEFIFSLDRGKI